MYSSYILLKYVIYTHRLRCQLFGVEILMRDNYSSSKCIAVVIPCYKVARHILKVIAAIGNEVSRIYVVDDACPEQSGKLVETNCHDERVSVLYHSVNQGVGAAVMTGYRAAIQESVDIIVKIDGDGQMDPSLIPSFVAPIFSGEADYTKGNRFFYLEEIRAMPTIRLVGNAILSFMSKLSTGYWNVFDPTNGYTAIHTNVARHLPFDKISKRYFFETDVLFRLNTLNAVVVDIPMDAQYGNEISNLKISKIFTEFLFKHTRNLFKRIFYNYYLRGLSIASLELPIGLFLMVFGDVFGLIKWHHAANLGVSTPLGTIMLSALPILVGMQFILAFLGYDIASVPIQPVNMKMNKIR